MIVGAICIGLIIRLVQDLNDEKELIAARQAKLAMDVANQTLPYFHQITRSAFESVCEIIRREIGADAVAITDTQDVLAYAGTGRECYALEGITPSAS